MPPSPAPESFRTAFERAAVGMGIVDFTDARWLEANDALCRMVGYSRQEMRQTPWPQITHPEDIDADLIPFRRMAAGELDSYVVEKRFVHKHGRIVWARLTLSLVRDERGAPAYEVAVVEDITDRQEAQQALAESEERLRLAIGAAALGVWDLDLVRDVAVRSARHDEIFGYAEPQPEWGLEIALRHVLPEDRPAVLAAHDRARETGVLYHESRVVWPDGSLHWIEAHGRVHYDRQDRPLRIAGVVADVTGRKHVEERLRHLNEDLERRVEERTAELRGRAAQLARLASELTIAEQRERQRIARVLHDHLQQLLVAARMNLEGGEADKAGALIGEAIEAARSLAVELAPPILQTGGLAAGLEWLARWYGERHGLTVATRLDPQATTGSQEVRSLLFEAVRELLFNVVKHAGVSQAEVALEPAGPDHLRIGVSDRGRGFDPRVAAVARGGAGAGLLMVRERLELLGGRLEVASEPGRGTRFVLEAPRLPGQDAGPAEPGGTGRDRG